MTCLIDPMRSNALLSKKKIDSGQDKTGEHIRSSRVSKASPSPRPTQQPPSRLPMEASI